MLHTIKHMRNESTIISNINIFPIYKDYFDIRFKTRYNSFSSERNATSAAIVEKEVSAAYPL